MGTVRDLGHSRNHRVWDIQRFPTSHRGSKGNRRNPPEIRLVVSQVCYYHFRIGGHTPIEGGMITVAHARGEGTTGIVDECIGDIWPGIGTQLSAKMTFMSVANARGSPIIVGGL